VAVVGEQVDGDLPLLSPGGGGDGQQLSRPAVQLRLLGELPRVGADTDAEVAGHAVQPQVELSILGLDLVDLERQPVLVERRQRRAVAGLWAQQHPHLTAAAGGGDQLLEDPRRPRGVAMLPPRGP
jgi:hypothetical protein